MSNLSFSFPLSIINIVTRDISDDKDDNNKYFTINLTSLIE